MVVLYQQLTYIVAAWSWTWYRTSLNGLPGLSLYVYLFYIIQCPYLPFT